MHASELVYISEPTVWNAATRYNVSDAFFQSRRGTPKPHLRPERHQEAVNCNSVLRHGRPTPRRFEERAAHQPIEFADKSVLRMATIELESSGAKFTELRDF